MAANVLSRRVSDAKAVALVLGPLGASAQGTIDTFGPMYLERNCTVVAAGSPPLRFFLTQHRLLKPTAKAIIQETAASLRETGNETPLVVHLFSNGGAFLLEEMEVLMSEVDGMRQTQGEAAQEDCDMVSPEDVNLIKSRLEYQFFDSCPCYLHMLWDLTPYMNDSFPNPAWRPVSRKVYFLASAFSLTMWCSFTGSPSRSSSFWSRMQNSTYCKHQIFFFTTADMLTDATRIDQLIERRRQELKTSIVTRRYDDSNHCAMYKDHAEDYSQVLDESLAAAIDRRK